LKEYWINKLNLEKRARGAFINWMNYRNRLIRLLKRNGPMPRKEAMETLGLRYNQIEEILRMFPETFQKLNFTVHRRKHSKKFHSLSKASPVLTLRDDPRIVDFVASKINMKVKTPYEAKSVVQLLKYQIGSHQARAVVERLGYKYNLNHATARIPSKENNRNWSHDREGYEDLGGEVRKGEAEMPGVWGEDKSRR